MKTRNFLYKLLLAFLLIQMVRLIYVQPAEACTIGVASGKATADGRPLLWKTRDLQSRPNNEIYTNTSYRYKFVSVVNAGGTYAWMGLNEKGFAILNSYSGDLQASDSGLTNGLLMRDVLGNCATVAEFQHFLDSTNVAGRQTHANFGVIDSTGQAAIFETGGTFYRKFDANNAAQAPNGYVLRTNFSVTGGGNSGIERYHRTVKLIGDFYSGDTLNYRSILRYQMRDFSDFDSNPVPVPFPERWKPDRPFGYIYTGVSICRSSSVSAAVIQGILTGESPKLSTMWAILGQPASSIALPYWPAAQTPPEAGGDPTAPLCDEANKIKALLFDYLPNTNYIDSYKLRNAEGGGLWARTFPAEDSIFTDAEAQLQQWRTNGVVNISAMEKIESGLARYALIQLKQAYTGLISSVSDTQSNTVTAGFSLKQNYPNPFNPMTRIRFSLPVSCTIHLTIYNVTGKAVLTLASGPFKAGTYFVSWSPKALAGGVYFYRLTAKPVTGTRPELIVQTKKLLYLK